MTGNRLTKTQKRIKVEKDFGTQSNPAIKEEIPEKLKNN